MFFMSGATTPTRQDSTCASADQTGVENSWWTPGFAPAQEGRVGAMLSEATTVSDWRARSACLQTDPELFFPVGSTGPAVRQVDQAKRVCGSCPVRRECLQWALDERQDHGVWGGLSEDERRALRRRSARHRNARHRTAVAV
jgi:WhiB family redox-sensing transcriptional regulator